MAAPRSGLTWAGPVRRSQHPAIVLHAEPATVQQPSDRMPGLPAVPLMYRARIGDHIYPRAAPTGIGRKLLHRTGSMSASSVP